MTEINKLRELLSSYDTIEEAPERKDGDYLVRIDHQNGGVSHSLTSRNVAPLSRRDDFRLTYIGWNEDDDGRIEEIHYLVDSVDSEPSGSTRDDSDEQYGVGEATPTAEMIFADVQAASGNGEEATLATLDAVRSIVKERDGDVDPFEIHEEIARTWSWYLDVDLSPKDAARMMELFKVARDKTSDGDRDDDLDAVGYSAIAAALNGGGE